MTVGPKIVVTGTGMLTALGLNVEDSMSRMFAGENGIDRITQFDSSRLPVHFAGEVKAFVPEDFMDRKLARRIGRSAQFAVVAAGQALEQSGLDVTSINPLRMGTVIATAVGDFIMLEEQMRYLFEHGPGRTNPFTVSRVSTGMAAGNVGIHYNLQGPTFGTGSACASGAHSIAAAWMLLKLGFADAMLAGGVESAVTESFMESFCAMRALSTRNDDPKRASRPFDKNRDGFVMAEGAGVLLLETEDHAKRRGATILGEVAGVGMSCDAFHVTSNHPDGRGAAQAMTMALESAGLKTSEINYINAHGTATPTNDPIETKAIKTVFGDRSKQIPVSSIKSMIGHSIGAAGAIEAITSLECIRRGAVPPTINLEEPDTDCDLDYVPGKSRKVAVNTVLSSSFAFGGQNCVLILKRHNE